MIAHPGLLMSVGAFLLVIGPLVFIHEMGHYLAGRRFGIGAEVFSIGFGREIVGWTDQRGTRWKVGWLPLGGYVRFAGDMSPAGGTDPNWLLLPAAQRNRTFQAKRLWQRAIVVAAGPAVNLVAAILILAGFALAYGEVRTPPVAGAVLPGSPAAAAGIRPGDRLTQVAGRTIADFNDIAGAVLLHAGDRITVDYQRGGRAASAQVTVATAVERDRFGNTHRIGRLGIASTRPTVVRVSPLDALRIALRQFADILTTQIDGIGRIVTGRIAIKELNGPIGTARIAGEQLALGWASFVFLVALVSINLGFINLLPVPMLDGGHLFFYAIEAVRRRPLGERAQEWAFRGGLAALAALMLVVTINDLGSFAFWKDIAGFVGPG